jgi:hypothetical protein
LSIKLIFHGPAKAAKRTAARAGFPIRTTSRTVDWVHATAPCNSFPQVRAEALRKATTRANRGYPPGTLLGYNAAACATSKHRQQRHENLGGRLR